jgi:hypothetical protein
MRATRAGVDTEPGQGSTTTAERVLSITLRVAGTVLLVAFGASVMPSRSMSLIHRQLAMGEFPASPLVDYLTRSISLLYGIKGGLYWVLATDVRRYTPVIRYVAWTTIGFGGAVLVIDLHARMPPFWILGEGPPIAIVGAVFLALLRGVRRVDPL